MLIVEGPDGAGKTTLVETLKAMTGFEVAPRVVSAETKALTDLMVWTERNVDEGFQEKIFDRHRLISDPIYRFAIRAKQMDPRLYNIQWMSQMYGKFQLCDPIVVYCLPPFGTVKRNLEGDENNRAVIADIDRVYYMYSALVAREMFLSRIDNYHYDYTRDNEAHMLSWVNIQLHKRGVHI